MIRFKWGYETRMFCCIVFALLIIAGLPTIIKSCKDDVPVKVECMSFHNGDSCLYDNLAGIKDKNLIYHSIENSLAIWLAVIAAICTMLPIVFSFMQHKAFDYRMKNLEERHKEDVKRHKKEYTEELQKYKHELEELKDVLSPSSVLLSLNTVAQNIQYIFKILGNKGNEEVKLYSVISLKMIENVHLNIEFCEKKIEEELNKEKSGVKNVCDEDLIRIYLFVVSVLLYIKELCKKYEGLFSDESIYTLTLIRFGLNAKLIQLNNEFEINKIRNKEEIFKKILELLYCIKLASIEIETLLKKCRI